MMALHVVLSLLLSLCLSPAWAQGVNPVHPVNPSGSRLFPNAFTSADNIAAQTATFMHGGLMAWDSGGGNWDRLLLTSGALHVNLQNASIAVTQSGTWTVQPGNTQNTTAWLTQPQGNVAHDAVDSGNPTKIGCHARTTNRTAVADADRADIICDDNGQLVVTPMAPRDRVVRSGVVTVSTTTETTLLAAGGAGVFRDLTYLKCTNNSATLVRIDLRDATAGTVIDSWALAASGGGFNLAFSVPYAQASANNNWTIQLSGAVTDVRCSCQAVEKN